MKLGSPSLLLNAEEKKEKAERESLKDREKKRKVFGVRFRFFFFSFHLTHCHRVTSVPRAVSSSLSKNSSPGKREPSTSAAKSLKS